MTTVDEIAPVPVRLAWTVAPGPGASFVVVTPVVVLLMTRGIACAIAIGESCLRVGES
jgi:hypothetical protein